uniref:General transcription factor IIA subunit 1 like n=1 Tax=Ornithorhynchus anatinus TaxID=9258 RepID=F7FT16_ORNAN
MACANPVPILYRSVIEDVIEGMRELFAEEGVDEQVLNDLKQLWETKVVQSKATEGFFKNTLHMPLLTLKLPSNMHQTLHTSTASLVIPAGRSVSSFTRELGTSSNSANSTFPPGIGYPIHVPAGVTLQTASGQLYKVNIPVVVTQAPEGGGLLQHQIQTIFQRLGQPPVAVGAEPQVPDAGFRLPPWELGEGKASGGATGDARASPPPSVGEDGTPAVEPGPRGTPQVVPWAVAGLQASGPHREADDGVWLPAPGRSGDESPRGEWLLPPGMASGGPGGSEEASPSEPGIIQLDGAGDAWSGRAEGSAGEADENEFLGMMGAEDLKALDEEGDTASNGDSTSGDDSSSDGDEREDPQLDVVEEDPLNSGDDVSEQDVPDLFETDNVIVCQYDKIHRSKNKWKFYLKDGVMCFGGKDYVFARATGDAEW